MKKPAGSSNILPERVIVIDDDPTISLSVATAMRKLGVESVSPFTGGSAAWEAIKEQEFDLFILDWKLPQISGVALLNRIRGIPKYRFVPILVISGFITGKDFRLVEELPLTLLVEKPFNLNFLIMKFQTLSKEYQWFLEEKSKIEGLLRDLDGKKASALTEVAAVIASAPKPTPLRIATARILIEHNRDQEAELILEDTVKADPNCVVALHELGKLQLRSGRFEEALRTLAMAEQQSPQNLERLCLMGNVSLNTLDTESAQDYFRKALAIDGEDQTALAGSKIATNMNEYFSRFDVTTVPASFAGLMNAIGISLVRTGNFENGIEHYKSAMFYVDKDELKAKLAFNVGLGFMRWRKPEGAKEWFQKAWDLSGETHHRAHSYLDSIGKENAPVELDIEGESLWEDLGMSPTKSSNETPQQTMGRAESTKPLPPEEMPTEQLFAIVQELAGRLRFADSGLLAEIGLGHLRKGFDSYAGIQDDAKVCVIVPNSMRPKEIQLKTEQEAEAKGILVYRFQKSGWTKIWPRTEKLKAVS